jgi:hypothetical protein
MYFVSFIVITVFVVVNLFIAVVTNNLQAVKAEADQDPKSKLVSLGHDNALS